MFITPLFVIAKPWKRLPAASSEAKIKNKNKKAEKMGIKPKCHSGPGTPVSGMIIILLLPSLSPMEFFQLYTLLHLCRQHWPSFCKGAVTRSSPVPLGYLWTVSETGLFGLSWWLHHTVAVSPWTSYLNSLGFSFFICRVGALIVFIPGL